MVNKSGRRRFGTVRKLPSGRYQSRYSGPDGILRSADSTFATKTEAERWLVLKEAELMQGDWIDPDLSQVALEEYADAWIREHPKLQVTTEKLYARHLRLRITPSLGRLALVDVSSPRIRKWRHNLLTAGETPGNVAKAYRFLRAVLNTAVADGYIRSNPCNIRGAGVEKAAERPIATVEQVFELADAMGDRWRSMVLLATFGGLRFGELVGLRRRYIDIDKGRIQVRWSNVQPDSGPMFDGDPKTDAGKRWVSLPSLVTPELRDHLARFVEADPDALVFVGPKGGRPRRSNFHVIWNKARLKAGVPDLHFHDLRHTGATFVAATGATMADLMARMGHASPRAALIYQHATRDQDTAIALRLNSLIETALASSSSTDDDAT